jgi:hypothetical protein
LAIGIALIGLTTLTGLWYGLPLLLRTRRFKSSLK